MRKVALICLSFAFTSCGSGGGGGGGNGGPPVITSSGTATGTVGSPFSYQTTATRSPSSFSATGLPAGLALNPSSGVISGTPEVEGSNTVSLAATNGAGTGTKNLAIQIAAQPVALLVPDTALPEPAVTLQNSGYVPALRFKLSNGGIRSLTIQQVQVDVEGANALPGSQLSLVYNNTEIASAPESGGIATFAGVAEGVAGGEAKEFEVQIQLPDVTTWETSERTKSSLISIAASGIQVQENGTAVTGSSVFGRRLYRERGTIAFPRNIELFLGDLETGMLTLLTTTEFNYERDAVFSSDNTKLVYTAVNQEGSSHSAEQIGTVNADGTGRTQIPTPCVNPFGGIALDPTDSFVIHSGQCNRGPGEDDWIDIVASKLDRSGMVNLTNDAAFDYSPATKNGTDVFYVSCNSDASRSTAVPCGVFKMVVNLSGGTRVGERMLIYDGFSARFNALQPRLLALSPDGTKLLLSIPGQSSVIMTTDGTVLSTLPPMTSPWWSSDGRIFYNDSDNLFHGRFRVVDEDGTNDRLLPELFWEDCANDSWTTCNGGIAAHP